MPQEIKPHGGILIDRLAKGSDRENLLEKASKLLEIKVNERVEADIEMIAIGGFSPLEGFMGQSDYVQVVDHKRLANGLPWTIPITLAVSTETADRIKVDDQVVLSSENGDRLAILTVAEKFQHDKVREAQLVYGTDEEAHPGVKALYDAGDVLLAGPIDVLQLPHHDDFVDYRKTPAEMRALFREKGWRRIVGFQTRNPIHRAHEYITKCALEITDGLLIHPLVGATKSDDVPASVRMKCYQLLMENYYPKDRTVLAVFPAAMRYAGPREAILHAIARKNFGCTHFIVGRDHAGVGKYYGTFDAHYIFDEFEPSEMEITPLFFDHTFYCKRSRGMASFKTSPSNDPEERIILSGTAVREMLSKGQIPPEEFTRPEVAKILIEAFKIPNYAI
ncbi:MAG: sulfate adenylyltransferase [Candidatus Omnitrophica bacterium COP1]|nr:sulfate adenylyltransferase [Candidatus Omnitrophica bacterium COP1]